MRHTLSSGVYDDDHYFCDACESDVVCIKGYYNGIDQQLLEQAMMKASVDSVGGGGRQ